MLKKFHFYYSKPTYAIITVKTWFARVKMGLFDQFWSIFDHFKSSGLIRNNGHVTSLSGRAHLQVFANDATGGREEEARGGGRGPKHLSDRLEMVHKVCLYFEKSSFLSSSLWLVSFYGKESWLCGVKHRSYFHFRITRNGRNAACLKWAKLSI